MRKFSAILLIILLLVQPFTIAEGETNSYADPAEVQMTPDNFDQYSPRDQAQYLFNNPGNPALERDFFSDPNNVGMNPTLDDRYFSKGADNIKQSSAAAQNYFGRKYPETEFQLGIFADDFKYDSAQNIFVNNGKTLPLENLGNIIGIQVTSDGFILRRKENEETKEVEIKGDGEGKLKFENGQLSLNKADGKPLQEFGSFGSSTKLTINKDGSLIVDGPAVGSTIIDGKPVMFTNRAGSLTLKTNGDFQAENAEIFGRNFYFDGAGSKTGLEVQIWDHGASSLHNAQPPHSIFVDETTGVGVASQGQPGGEEVVKIHLDNTKPTATSTKPEIEKTPSDRRQAARALVPPSGDLGDGGEVWIKRNAEGKVVVSAKGRVDVGFYEKNLLVKNAPFFRGENGKSEYDLTRNGKLELSLRGKGTYVDDTYGKLDLADDGTISATRGIRMQSDGASLNLVRDERDPADVILAQCFGCEVGERAVSIEKTVSLGTRIGAGLYQASDSGTFTINVDVGADGKLNYQFSPTELGELAVKQRDQKAILGRTVKMELPFEDGTTRNLEMASGDAGISVVIQDFKDGKAVPNSVHQTNLGLHTVVGDAVVLTTDANVAATQKLLSLIEQKKFSEIGSVQFEPDDALRQYLRRETSIDVALLQDTMYADKIQKAAKLNSEFDVERAQIEKQYGVQLDENGNCLTNACSKKFQAAAKNGDTFATRLLTARIKATEAARIALEAQEQSDLLMGQDTDTKPQRAPLTKQVQQDRKTLGALAQIRQANQEQARTVAEQAKLQREMSEGRLTGGDDKILPDLQQARDLGGENTLARKRMEQVQASMDQVQQELAARGTKLGTISSFFGEALSDSLSSEELEKKYSQLQAQRDELERKIREREAKVASLAENRILTGQNAVRPDLAAKIALDGRNPELAQEILAENLQTIPADRVNALQAQIAASQGDLVGAAKALNEIPERTQARQDADEALFDAKIKESRQKAEQIEKYIIQKQVEDYDHDNSNLLIRGMEWFGNKGGGLVTKYATNVVDIIPGVDNAGLDEKREDQIREEARQQSREDLNQLFKTQNSFAHQLSQGRDSGKTYEQTLVDISQQSDQDKLDVIRALGEDIDQANSKGEKQWAETLRQERDQLAKEYSQAQLITELQPLKLAQAELAGKEQLVAQLKLRGELNDIKLTILNNDGKVSSAEQQLKDLIARQQTSSDVTEEAQAMLNDLDKGTYGIAGKITQRTTEQYGELIGSVITPDMIVGGAAFELAGAALKFMRSAKAAEAVVDVAKAAEAGAKAAKVAEAGVDAEKVASKVSTWSKVKAVLTEEHQLPTAVDKLNPVKAVQRLGGSTDRALADNVLAAKKEIRVLQAGEQNADTARNLATAQEKLKQAQTLEKAYAERAGTIISRQYGITSTQRTVYTEARQASTDFQQAVKAAQKTGNFNDPKLFTKANAVFASSQRVKAVTGVRETVKGLFGGSVKARAAGDDAKAAMLTREGLSLEEHLQTLEKSGISVFQDGKTTTFQGPASITKEAEAAKGSVQDILKRNKLSDTFKDEVSAKSAFPDVAEVAPQKPAIALDQEAFPDVTPVVSDRALGQNVIDTLAAQAKGTVSDIIPPVTEKTALTNNLRSAPLTDQQANSLASLAQSTPDVFMESILPIDQSSGVVALLAERAQLNKVSLTLDELLRVKEIDYELLSALNKDGAIDTELLTKILGETTDGRQKALLSEFIKTDGKLLKHGDYLELRTAPNLQSSLDTTITGSLETKLVEPLGSTLDEAATITVTEKVAGTSTTLETSVETVLTEQKAVAELSKTTPKQLTERIFTPNRVNTELMTERARLIAKGDLFADDLVRVKEIDYQLLKDLTPRQRELLRTGGNPEERALVQEFLASNENLINNQPYLELKTRPDLEVAEADILSEADETELIKIVEADILDKAELADQGQLELFLSPTGEQIVEGKNVLADVREFKQADLGTSSHAVLEQRLSQRAIEDSYGASKLPVFENQLEKEAATLVEISMDRETLKALNSKGYESGTTAITTQHQVLIDFANQNNLPVTTLQKTTFIAIPEGSMITKERVLQEVQKAQESVRAATQDNTIILRTGMAKTEGRSLMETRLRTRRSMEFSGRGEVSEYDETVQAWFDKLPGENKDALNDIFQGYDAQLKKDFADLEVLKTTDQAAYQQKMIDLAEKDLQDASFSRLEIVKAYQDDLVTGVKKGDKVVSIDGIGLGQKNKDDVARLTAQELTDEQLAQQIGVNIDNSIREVNAKILSSYEAAVDQMSKQSPEVLQKYADIAEAAGYSTPIRTTEDLKGFLKWEFETRGRFRGGDEAFMTFRKEVLEANPRLSEELAETIRLCGDCNYNIRVGIKEVAEDERYTSLLAKSDAAVGYSKKVGDVPVTVSAQGDVFVNGKKVGKMVDGKVVEDAALDTGRVGTQTETIAAADSTVAETTKPSASSTLPATRESSPGGVSISDIYGDQVQKDLDRLAELGGSLESRQTVGVKGELESQLERQFDDLTPLLDSDAGVSEGYTIREHTRMVAETYESQAKFYNLKGMKVPADVDLERLMPHVIELHDIGKPKAIAAGSKTAQHAYTLPILREKLVALGFSENEVKVAEALVGNDIIGELIKGEISTVVAGQRLQAQAALAQIELNDYFQLQRLFYASDAGSYPNLRAAVFSETLEGKLNPYPLLKNPFNREGGSGGVDRFRTLEDQINSRFDFSVDKPRLLTSHGNIGVDKAPKRTLQDVDLRKKLFGDMIKTAKQEGNSDLAASLETKLSRLQLGEDVQLPKYFHTTNYDGLNGILKDEVIKVAHGKGSEGAFVSTIPQFTREQKWETLLPNPFSPMLEEYGHYAFIFSDDIEAIPIMQRDFRQLFVVDVGFAQAIPLEKNLIGFVTTMNTAEMRQIIQMVAPKYAHLPVYAPSEIYDEWRLLHEAEKTHNLESLIAEGYNPLPLVNVNKQRFYANSELMASGNLNRAVYDGLHDGEILFHERIGYGHVVSEGNNKFFVFKGEDGKISRRAIVATEAGNVQPGPWNALQIQEVEGAFSFTGKKVKDQDLGTSDLLDLVVAGRAEDIPSSTSILTTPEFKKIFGGTPRWGAAAGEEYVSPVKQLLEARADLTPTKFKQGLEELLDVRTFPDKTSVKLPSGEVLIDANGRATFNGVAVLPDYESTALQFLGAKEHVSDFIWSDYYIPRFKAQCAVHPCTLAGDGFEDVFAAYVSSYNPAWIEPLRAQAPWHTASYLPGGDKRLATWLRSNIDQMPDELAGTEVLRGKNFQIKVDLPSVASSKETYGQRVIDQLKSPFSASEASQAREAAAAAESTSSKSWWQFWKTDEVPASDVALAREQLGEQAALSHNALEGNLETLDDIVAADISSEPEFLDDILEATSTEPADLVVIEQPFQGSYSVKNVPDVTDKNYMAFFKEHVAPETVPYIESHRQALINSRAISEELMVDIQSGFKQRGIIDEQGFFIDAQGQRVKDASKNDINVILTRPDPKNPGMPALKDPYKVEEKIYRDIMDSEKAWAEGKTGNFPKGITPADARKMVLAADPRDKIALRDIAGMRITVSNPGEEERVVQLIEQRFGDQIIGKKDFLRSGTEGGAYRDDGYRSIHYIVLQDGKPVEIQIRTPSQTSWADWTHDTIYKGELKDNTVAKQYAQEVGDRIFNLERGMCPDPCEIPDCPEVLKAAGGCFQFS